MIQQSHTWTVTYTTDDLGAADTTERNLP